MLETRPMSAISTSYAEFGRPVKLRPKSGLNVARVESRLAELSRELPALRRHGW
jgi:hypothetical protein